MLPKSEHQLIEEEEIVKTDDIPSLLPELNQDKQIQRYVLGELVESSKRLSEPASVRFAIDEDALCATPKPGFLEWPAFEGATLPPRVNLRKSRLSRVLWPLNSLRVGLPGDVSVEGFGGIIESAHGLFHSVQRLDYMESERRIHLQRKPGTPPPNTLPRLELERFENELFDLSKYDGSCEYLTVLAWTEEGESGSITLYKMLFGDTDETVGMRPVAAMRDVPTSVLVKMRAYERIKRKVVFTPINDNDQRFKWKMNVSKGPTYIKLGRSGRSISPLRSVSRSRSRRPRAGLADAEGICATIPQFVALLHARRAILEDVKSTSITPLRTADGELKPGISLIDSPRQNPHDGDSVHVAVMIPNDAPWAEEEMIWTDKDGLVEFRQARYWNLIEPASTQGRQGRGRSRSRRREDSRGPRA